MMRLSVLVLALLALLAAPFSPARAAKPQPPPPAPQLVAVVEGGLPGCVALVAIDDRGTLYTDCGVTGTWQIAGQVAGTPVHMIWNPYGPRHLLVTMANGDVWASDTGLTPLTFTLLSNVFASAGVSARLPAFPDITPLEDARPIITNEPELDAPGMVK